MLTKPRVSNANQSPVPIGNNPIDRHFHSPIANVKRLQSKYTIFCSGSVVSAFGSGECFLSPRTGENGANAEHAGLVSEAAAREGAGAAHRR